ncbi:MAG: DNA-binding transcriptional regulator [Planctomycetia bacterium]|nr:DNA-binding transcriptional regulator [Planctomycetia bacterium]
MVKKKKVFLAIESSHAYGRGLLLGISQYIQERNHWQIHLEGRGMYEDYLPWLENWQGDGIIVRTFSREMSRALQYAKAPVVELLGDGDPDAARSGTSEVRTDEESICLLAINHFFERGVRHVAFYSYGQSWWLADRSAYFERTARKYGLDCRQFHEATDRSPSILPVASREQEDLIQWLRELPKPVGLWGATDLMAIRVMNVCLDIGLTVPDEVAILGTDNDLHFCLMSSPRLSSIDLAPEKVGYQSAVLLDRKMNGQQTGTHAPIIVQPNGICPRASSDTLAIDDPSAAKIIRYIRENATFGLTVSDVRRQFDVIPRTLERTVKKYLGRSPEAEIKRIRMEHARKLLYDTRLSVSEVSRLSGFQSPEYFVKTFKKENGKSPLQYRNTHNQLNQ